MITKKTLRIAIESKCKECIYDKRMEGTVRQQVEKCTSYSCPLYNFRPIPTDSHPVKQVQE